MTSNWTRWAGLIGAPAFWMINTQLGQMLPSAECQTRFSWSLLAAALALLAALASAGISWSGLSENQSRTSTFLSYLSVFVALAIAFALLLQGAATLMIDACDR
jgi:surface polysaccharide O-acyltransferase-like enzyme